MMSVNYNRANLLGFVAFLLLSACSKDVIPGNNDGDALPMTIQPEVVSTDGALKSNDGGATKATLINEAAGLRTQGFGLSLYDGTTALKSKVEMEYTSGAWAPKGGTMDWKWPAGRTFSFYAWSPADLPVGTVTSTGVPAFTYSGIADQKDIMLGTYTGTGDNGAAPIKFYHPLASIQFKTGKMTNLKTLNKIELEGVITSGTCTPTMSGTSTTFAWSALGTTTTTLSQTGLSVASATSGTAIGTPFLTLPQTSQPLTVKITDSDNNAILATITAPALTAGHTAVYTIDYDGLKVTLSVSIKNWGAGQSEDVPMEEKTRPDPEYWVDLGMVSKNGYPLYISRRDVDDLTLDDNTGKYIVSWAVDETTPGSYSLPNTTLPTNIETEDGLPCRIINSDELLAFCLGDNFTFDFSGTPFAKGRNENIVYFPSEDYKGGDNNIALCIKRDNSKVYGNGVSGQRKVKLVYEDIYSNRIPLFEPILTSCPSNVLGSNQFDYPGPSFFIVTYDDENAPAIQHPCGSGAKYTRWHFLTIIKCENQFRLVSFCDENLPEGLSYSITKKDGTPTLNYSIDPGTNVLHYLGTEDGGTESKRVTVTLNGVSHWFNYNYFISCFVKGTLITLANGTKKPVEEITYDDELKVWNFDKGCYDSAKPFWITKAGQTTEQYYRMTFSDGTVLNILGPQYKSGHKLYNYTDRKFEGVKTLEVGKEVYTENGVVTLVSKEEVNEEVEFYCLMTENHLNCFAEGVLASLRYNNIYPFDENMKFIKDGRSRRPYKEFKAAGISREWYNGLRLGEQTDDLDTIKKYVDRYDVQTREKPAPSLWQRLKTWWKSIFG